jgi:hypothetical protein
MKKLLLPLFVSLIVMSSYSNADINSVDERFTLLCEIEDSTGFNWSDGNWHRTNFKGGQKYIIKKEADEKSIDDADFNYSDATYEMCTYSQKGESRFFTSVSRDACYSIKEFGKELNFVDSNTCRETWSIDEQGVETLDTVNCPYHSKEMTFKLNGLIHTYSGGSLEASPEGWIVDGVTKIPADYKDSMYIGFGRCSTI